MNISIIKEGDRMYNPKCLDNLRSFDSMEKQKHLELSRKGGKASAAARKHRKKQRQALDAILRYGNAIQILLELSDMSVTELRQLMKSR